MEVNMFRFVPFVFRLILLLVVIGGLLMGGYAVYNSGLSNGYAQGIAANPQLEGQTAPQSSVPYMPYAPYGMRPFYGPHFGFFGFPFFGFFCLAFLLPLIFFGLFRPWGWRRHAWYHHGWGPQGPDDKDRPWGGPPWQHGEKPAAEPPVAEKAE
jgi:hypothetical protein